MEGRSQPAVVRASGFHRDLSARRRLSRARGPVPRRTAVRGGALTRRAVPQRSRELLRDRPPLGDPVECRDDPAAVPGGAARVRRPHRDRGRVLLGAGSPGGELRQHRADRRRGRVLRSALPLVVSRGARRPAPAPLRARGCCHRPGRRLPLLHGRARTGAGRGLVDRALGRPEPRDSTHACDRTGRGARVCSRSRRRSSSWTGTRCRARSRPRPSAPSPTTVPVGSRTSGTTWGRRSPTRSHGSRRSSRWRGSRSPPFDATPADCSWWDSRWCSSA